MSPLLEAVGVQKSFLGARALADGRLALAAGEIHALVGENGAGKSTLARILAGAVARDAGTITLAGRPWAPATPKAALRGGVHLVHQELSLVPGMSVAENVFLGREPVRGLLLDRRTAAVRAEAALAQLGLQVDPRTPVHRLALAERQLVELARASCEDVRVLLLDEPTAALSPPECERLFAVMRRLAAAGTAIVFVTHRLDEVFALCDAVTVLRDGVWVSTDPIRRVTPAAVVERMVGRVLPAAPRRAAVPGPVVLALEQASGEGFDDVGLALRRGEIHALAGIAGSGRSEVARALAGAPPPARGVVRWRGAPVRIEDPRRALAAGIAFLGEDRQRDGIVPTRSVRENVALASLGARTRAGLLDLELEHATVARVRAQLGIKVASLEQPLVALSGGNQQKALLARLLLTGAEVLIVDEPTRGIDLASKSEIHALLRRGAARGQAILIVSSDLLEVVALADRVTVMCHGRVAGELDGEAITATRVLTLATFA